MLMRYFPDKAESPCRGLSAFLLVSLLGLFLSGCATAPGATGQDNNLNVAHGKFQQSLEFGTLGLYDKQIATLKEAIELAPGELNYRTHLGGALMASGKTKEAEKEFLDILKTDSNYKAAYRELGRLYMERGEWRRAVTYFKEDLSRPGTPMPHQVYNWLAWSYYNLGEIDKAEDEWRNALRISENPGIRLNLALSYKNREHYDEAMESLEKAVSLDPRLFVAHYEMALLYLRKENKEDAVDHFKKVVSLAPNSEQAKSSREYLNMVRRSQ